MSNEIKVHLDVKEAKTLKRAAKLTDEYVLSHKSVCKEKRSFDDKDTRRKYGSSSKGESRGARSPGPCFNCGKRGHLIPNCPRNFTNEECSKAVALRRQERNIW